MDAITREHQRAYNKTVGTIDKFTLQDTLISIYQGDTGFGFGIWFAARKELIARGLLIDDGNQDTKLWVGGEY